MDHRDGSVAGIPGATLVPGRNGGSLLRVPKGGQSPNPSGQTKQRMLTAALEKRLRENENLADEIAGWWLKMIEDGDSTALKEALVRLEGHVPRDAQRELPRITLNVQSVQQTQVNGQPVTPSRPPSPALHVDAEVVNLKPFTPPDEDDEE